MESAAMNALKRALEELLKANMFYKHLILTWAMQVKKAMKDQGCSISRLRHLGIHSHSSRLYQLGQNISTFPLPGHKLCPLDHDSLRSTPFSEEQK